MRRTSRRPVPDMPGPGQESVWDYPRPPRLERTDERVEVRLRGALIAVTRRPFRVLETSHAPTYYVPRADVDVDVLVPIARRTVCEWKGLASYADLVVPVLVSTDRGATEDGSTDPGATARRVLAACWWFDVPTTGFAELAGAVAFYPELVDATVDDEPVSGVPGGFYGSWVTSRVVGPFKGGPGTEAW